MIDAAAWLFLLLQIFFVDLLLGADNAIVIALACRRLPPPDARRAVFFGAIGAIALRLSMVLFANTLLEIPLIKLVGAWMLVVIALNVRARKSAEDPEAPQAAASAGDFVSAAAAIMLADAAMSLDNVVALAAIARGVFPLLALGVLLSIPIIAYGALILTQVIRHAPEILTLGAAFLGWIAGGMAVSDPLVSAWISSNAPALGALAPALVALFVLLAGSGSRPAPRPLAAGIAAIPAEKRPQPRLAATPVVPQRTPAAPTAAKRSCSQAFAGEAAKPLTGSWTEERVVVAGFVLLAFLAGLIIFVASFFDSLT